MRSASLDGIFVSRAANWLNDDRATTRSYGHGLPGHLRSLGRAP